MNILQIISSKDVGGGSQEHTRFLSLGLKEKGHRVLVICRPGSLVNAYRREGLEVYPLELREKNKAIKTIQSLIRERSFEVVHTHNRDADVPGLVAAAKAGVPVIVSTIHAFINLDKYGRPKMNFPLWKYNHLLKKIPHKIITVSNALQQNLLEKLDLDKERVLTILNAVDLSQLKVKRDKQEVRQELGIPPESRVVGAVGNLIAIKGYDYFIESASTVLKDSLDVKFLLVGDGNQRSVLREKVKVLNLEKDFIFAGYRDDIPDILQILDIFVHSSLLEALPRSVMEASGMGIPVVATEVGGTSEVVKDRESGLLIPPQNPNKLALTILYLLEHPEKAEDMGRIGKEWINGWFNASRMVEETETLLRELLEKSSKK